MIIRVCCSSHPVAIAPGSVFVDPRCQFLRLHGGLVAPCFWLHFTSFREREERGKTNTEPGAVATGIILHDHSSLLFKPPGRYRSRFCIRRPTMSVSSLTWWACGTLFLASLHILQRTREARENKYISRSGSDGDYPSLSFESVVQATRSLIAPGSVFVDQRCQFLRLHGGLVAPCFWLHFTSFREREERGKTNTEPRAVATGLSSSQSPVSSLSKSLSCQYHLR